MADEFFRPFFEVRRLGAGRARARALVQRVIDEQQQFARREVEPAGPEVHDRRIDVVDADDEGVRTARRLRRLRDAREGGHEVRLLHARTVPSSASPTPSGGSDNTTLRLADSVNVFETGALAHGVTVDTRGLPDSLVRCRHEVQGVLPADRDLQPLARQLQGGRRAAGREHPRHRLLHPGGVLPGAEEAGGLRRDVADLRRQERRVQQQLRVPGRERISTRSTLATTGSTSR